MNNSARNSPTNEKSRKANWRSELFLLFFCGIFALMVYFIWSIRITLQPIVQVALRSHLEADYSPDLWGKQVPRVGLQLIEEVIEEQDPTHAPTRFATIEVGLQTPVPTVTSGSFPTQTPALTLTPIATTTPTLAQSRTPTPTPRLTTITPTATPSGPSPTRTPTPTRTAFLSPTATQPVNTPIATWTLPVSTATRTPVASVAPTATPTLPPATPTLPNNPTPTSVPPTHTSVPPTDTEIPPTLAPTDTQVPDPTDPYPYP